MLLDLLLFLLVLSVLIFSHEFGHFIAARISGIKVERFAFGFGPALLKIQLKDTLFMICCIPLGGYVKLAGDERGDVKGLPFEFFSKPIGVRARVVFFGPLFNFILAFFIFWILFLVIGVPSLKPIVGDVMKYGPVAKSEFTPQQLQKLKEQGLIEELDGGVRYIVWLDSPPAKDKLKSIGFTDSESKHIMAVWQDSSKITKKTEFTPPQLQRLIESNVVTEKMEYWTVSSEQELTSQLSSVEGLELGEILALLHKSRYPAYKAGVRQNDLVLRVDEEPIRSWEEMSRLIRESKGTVTLTVLRDNNEENIEVVPEKMTVRDISGEEEISFIGIRSKTLRGNIALSFIRAAEKLFTLVGTMIKGLFFLIIQKIPFKEAIAGPIGISVITTQVAKVGIVPLVNFVGILSLSLAVINLFPFPVLDGGHLFFMAIEKIRKKPVSVKWENIISQIGVGILIALMLFVTYNDILKFGVKKSRFTQEQLQILKENKIVDELKNDGEYAFWVVPSEDMLRLKLSGIDISDSGDILDIWKNSARATEMEP